MWLSVHVALVRAGTMGNDGLVETFLEITTEAIDAALRFFRKLLLRGAIFDGAHGFPHLKLEVLEQRGKLCFQFAGAIAQLNIPFARKSSSFKIQGVMLFARDFSLLFELCKVLMQSIEEARNVDLLRPESLACRQDDASIQAEPFGSLNASRCAGNAETKLIVGHERDLVDTRRSV